MDQNEPHHDATPEIVAIHPKQWHRLIAAVESMDRNIRFLTNLVKALILLYLVGAVLVVLTLLGRPSGSG